MIRAIIENSFEINRRIASHHSLFSRFLDSFFYGRDVVLGDGSSEYLVLEFKVRPPGEGLHLYHDIPILTSSSCLLFIFSLNV